VTDNGGSVLFVELTAPRDVLLQRVTDESRKQHQKVVDREILTSLLQKNEYTATAPYDNILKIDTSKMSAPQVSELIVAHYKLA
jgi:RNase adaptor protein for sRNA GlmZ degradation